MEVKKLSILNLKAITELEKNDQSLSANDISQMLNSCETIISLGIFCNKQLIAYLFALKTQDFCDIIKIQVSPTHQRLGYAQKLLDHLLNLEQWPKIFLEVKVTNQPAIAFYLKNGFEVSRIRKNYYPQKIDALEMVKFCKSLKIGKKK